MTVYVITKGHDDTFVSVWGSDESAQREVDRLNEDERKRTGWSGLYGYYDSAVND